LHYGQAIFEGQKAYRRADGEIALFRPEQNARRFQRSARRMAMPPVPEELYLEAVETLVDLERDWVPGGEMQSLYIRPYMIATEPLQGVRAAKEYLFAVILSPVGAYYASGFKPVDILVSENYVRAAEGGTGEAKAAGNYAASLLAAREAREQECAQVLWLDAKERRYVEEIGAMNVMFVIDGALVTPPLNGTVLPGVTRNCVLEIARNEDLPVEERRLAIDDLTAAIGDGRCQEAFGCGTAAVITAIRSFHYRGKKYGIRDEPGPVSQKMFQTITDIQWGRAPDAYGWARVISRTAERSL
jgi:branched-chain amino acid aminotransferase